LSLASFSKNFENEIEDMKFLTLPPSESLFSSQLSEEMKLPLAQLNMIDETPRRKKFSDKRLPPRPRLHQIYD
jgi:hypothetical protein